MYNRILPHAVYRYLSILLIDICIPNVSIYVHFVYTSCTDARSFRPTVGDISLLSYEIVSAIKFLPDEANEIINVKFNEIREALDRGYYDRGGVFTRCARLQTEVCITRMHYTRYPGHGRV